MLTETNAPAQFAQFAEASQAYPGGFKGRGIVIPGGGARYFPSAWICISMLRDEGCTLPIELWHLGTEEMTQEMRDLLRLQQVDCVNANELLARDSFVSLGGWQLKPFAIVQSRFREIILIDADNFPLVDPEFLFDTPQYQLHGALFWSDYGRFASDNPIWRLTGVSYQDEPEFESGQIVVDKERCWKPLLLTQWMNQHSDFWYRYLYGDKDTFHLAWRKLNVEYAMTGHPIVSLPWVMCQHDFDGRRIFQHRNRAKWTLSGLNVRIPGFLKEERAFAHLENLRKQWKQPLREPPSPPPFEVASQLYHSDRLHEAEIYCRSILEKWPNDAQAWRLLGLVAHRTGHPVEAIQLIERSLRLGPLDGDSHNALGMVLGKFGRHGEAIQCFCRAVELCTESADAHNNLGVALEHVEDFDGAVTSYRRAIWKGASKTGSSALSMKPPSLTLRQRAD